MTTTPTTPTATTTILPTWVHTWINLVKAHEKMVVILIAGALAFHFYGKTINAWVDYEKSKAKPAQVIVQKDDTETKILAAQLAQLRQQYALQTQKLEADLAKTQADLATRQAQDAVLPLPELATRWEELVVAPAGSVTSNPNGTITVTGDVAHTTVSELEKVPALTEQLLDTQTELKGCTTLSTQKDTVIAQGVKDLTDEKTSHKDDVAQLKAEKKKSWLNGFKWGAIVGLVGGAFVGHRI
jgi:hypothetical protein